MRIRRRIVWGLLLLAFLGVGGTVGGFYAAGYRGYVIHTGSMVPTLVPGDLIVDRPADDSYRAGDIITFRHGPTPDLVTHRIVDVTPAGIHTKGDANPTADVWTIPRPYVEGVLRWTLPGLGYAVVFLKQPTGFASVVVIIIGLVLLWQLFFPSDVPAPSERPASVPDPDRDPGRDPDDEYDQDRAPGPARNPREDPDADPADVAVHRAADRPCVPADAADPEEGPPPASAPRHRSPRHLVGAHADSD